MVSLMQNPKKAGKKAAFTRWRNGASVTTREFTYTEWDNKQRMLFDLTKDSAENSNVAETPEYRETAKRLSQLLADGWEKAQP